MSTPHDFDFLCGHWQVRHRRLLRRLAGCDDWQTFAGTARCWPLLGGCANVDDNWLDLPAGAYHALSLRSWDAAARQWSIWWLDGRQPHALETPVRGAFEAGVGTFLAEDSFEGRPIKVRFCWTATATDTPRWEQAFSPDGGLHWEPNWTMDFSRAG